VIAETIGALAVILSVAVPGMLLSWAVLYRTAMGRFEKFFIGIILGLFIPPMLGVLEFVFLGMDMNFSAVAFNALLASATGLLLYYYQAKRLPAPKLRWRKEYATQEYWLALFDRNKTLVLLVLLVLFGFYGRYATSADFYFSEIDPFYYTHVTEFVATQGHIPLFNDDAYFPQLKFQRVPPLVHYMAAGWYFVWQGITNASYSKELVSAFMQLYPPLLGALLSFLGFLIVREEADRRIALVAAALFAFTPQLLDKMAAGVAEQQPFALFATMLIFSTYIIAVKTRSLRWGALAGLSAFLILLGSSQFVWPMMVITAYLFFASLMEFWAGELDSRWMAANAMVVLGALSGNVLQQAYSGGSPLNIFNGIQLFVASLAFAGLLFAAARYKVISRVRSALELTEGDAKLVFLAAGFLAFVAVMAFTPLGAKVGSYLNYGLNFAKPNSAIMMTVAEENPATDAMDLSSYGVFSYALSPRNLLMLSALLCYAIMFATLWRKDRKRLALLSAAIVAFVFVFNSAFDPMVQAVAEPFGLSSMAEFVGQNDIFYYLGLAIVSTVVAYVFADRKNKLPLLFVLIFFPISFIGIHKLKYIAHLATALPVAVAFMLFLLWELCEMLSHYFGSSAPRARKYSGWAVLALGAILVAAQFTHAAGWPVNVGCGPTGVTGVIYLVTYDLTKSINIAYAQPSSINGLCYQRIGTDWRDAMTWMSINLGQGDRVLSWWDYGHWTTFIAGKKTATDPGNAYPEYNQEVARALVNGPREELVRVMKYHNSSYLMLDSELISKWGALNFLSGTFAGLYREPDPAANYNVTPAADWTKGPGASNWEAEHAFEFVYPAYVAGEDGNATPMSCPGLISRQAVYSQLTGQVYCASPGQNGTINLFLLKATGDQVPLKNPKILQFGGGEPSYRHIGRSGSTNVFIDQNAAMLNLNPDLETITNGTVKSALFNAPYVQLFFYEKLDGFELVHKSPNSGVKIFRLTA
jgi:asparagine N-glycosylation enzyme membrane subunit Stt3